MAQESNKNNNHSFYREAKKSFYGSEGFSKEKGWKLTKKFSKWGLYGFLTITTLWGCVNEFIIKTGNQIGTGVEFYSNSSKVIPNTFESKNQMVWEATGKQDQDTLEQATNGLKEWEGTELKPFDMVTLNPDYGKTPEEDFPDYEEDDLPDMENLFIPIQEVDETKNTGQIKTAQYGIYNLDQLSENKVEVEGTESLYVAPSSSILPTYLKTTKDDEDFIEGEKEIVDWKGFYVDKLNNYQLYDPTGRLLDPNVNLDDNGNYVFENSNTDKYFAVSTHTSPDEDGNPINTPTITPRLAGYGWYAIPMNTDTSDPKNTRWQIVADSTIASKGMIEPEIKDIGGDEEITKISANNINAFTTNTAISIVNEIAYYTGEEISINDQIGNLLGINGTNKPTLQIQEIDNSSGSIDEKNENAKSYNEFYKLVKNNTESGNVSGINKNTTIGDIAINSTWSYMNQFTDNQSSREDSDKTYKVEDFYETTNKSDIVIYDSKYSADYKKILTSSTGEVHFGQSYYITPASSKEPMVPTYDALYTMQNLRPDDWDKEKKDLRKNKNLNNIYVDPLAQFAGWGLLDNNGNLRVIANEENSSGYYTIQQVYDDDNVSFYNDVGEYIYDDTEQKYGVLTEEEYYEALEPLFAMDRTDGWSNEVSKEGPPTDSAVNNNPDVNVEGISIDAHFDEMMFNYADPNNSFKSYYESILKTTIYKQDGTVTMGGIESSQYQIAYATPVVGIETNTQVGSKTRDYDDDPNEVIRGTTTPVSFTNQDIHKTALDSSLYNAQSKGIGEANTSRGIFAGWSDWGWAWNIKFGPLYGLFLFPISQIALFVQHFIFPFHIFGAWGVLLGVFFIVFFLRGVGSLMSFKSTSNQQKMQEVQVEVAKINAKYEKYGDNKQMKQRKQMEVMALYRKKEINPLGSFGTIFITMPIFISMWILISAIPVYKIAAIGNFSFSISALSGIFSSLFILYLLVGVSVGLMQGLSAKLPGWLAQKRKGVKQVTEAEKKAAKKQNKTQNIMVGVFIVIGLTVPVLLAFYWISSAIFTICLELGRHVYQLKKGKKVKQEK